MESGNEGHAQQVWGAPLPAAAAAGEAARANSMRAQLLAVSQNPQCLLSTSRPLRQRHRQPQLTAEKHSAQSSHREGPGSRPRASTTTQQRGEQR